MIPPGWGLPGVTNAMLLQIQQDLAQMQDRFDTVFKAMLGSAPTVVTPTPADVVATEHKLRLLHYHRAAERPPSVPLLIVPSLFNRYYLLDLLPGRSLVEHLVAHGIDVYMLDWGVPGPEDRSTTFDQYITGYLRRMVQRVRNLSGQERIMLLGYSIGGTLTAIFSALYGRYVHGLIQLAAPINFHDNGIISQWMRKERFNVDLVVDTLGSMPTELLRASSRMLAPTLQIAQQIALANQMGDTQAVQDLLALQSWITDGVPFPGEAYRTYIKDCYQENYLIQGKLIVGGKRVDLAQIACPLLTLTAAKDWICPPESAAVLNDIVASVDKCVLELPGGHVGIVAGHRASEQLWPKLTDWLITRATPLPSPSDHPPLNRPDPADIGAALRAGVIVAQHVEATQTMIEATSPLEALRQAAPIESGADTPPAHEMASEGSPYPAPDTPYTT
jgi:polyhydroxyalkanoate synthase subunit PhaC